MQKTFLIIALFIFRFMRCDAQTAAKSVYAELGGAGLASVNFDMRLQQKEDGLGFRVGIGGFSVRLDNGFGQTDRSGILTIPLELNYLLGKDHHHYFEMGAGATIVSLSNTNNSNGINTNDQFSSTFGHLYFGYRLQPADGGFLFRAGITPVFGKGYFVPYYAGISFGYKF